MVGSRGRTALLGLLASLGLSILLWQYFGSPVFFLFVPFVPFLFRRGDTRVDEGNRPPVRACEECGFQTRDTQFEFCPRDGNRLVER